MSKWEQVKEIKGLLTGIFSFISVAIVAGGFVLSLVIDSKIDAALSKQDLGTDTKIVAMDAERATNKRTGEENAKDISGLDRRTEMAFAALMGRPAPTEE